MSNDEILYNLGVDLNSSMDFHDGDIKLVKYEDNLVQSIANKLNTWFDELAMFYEGYGSVFRGFLGWHRNDETLGFIVGEVKTILINDDRIVDFKVNASYIPKGVRVDLVLKPNSNYTVKTSLALSGNGVEVMEV